MSASAQLSVLTLPSATFLRTYRVLAATQINGTISGSGSNFLPLPEMRETGGDIYLYALSAGAVVYTHKTLDPWYQATRLTGQIMATRFNGENGERVVDVYAQDEPGSALACVERHQVCAMGHNGTTHCSPLAGGVDAYAIIHDSMATEQATRERVNWILSAITSQGCSTAEIMDSLGIQALLSRRSLRAGMQGQLSDTQWQQEAEYWFNIGLACIQKAYVNVAVGLPPSFPDDLIIRPTKEEQHKLCRNQVQ